MKIFVIEDDKKLNSFLVRVLSEEGYVVDAATSGTDAARQAEVGTYDAIILDWMLPGLDGLSLCRELRRRGTLAPILMLTARGETHEKVLGLDAGADVDMVKPFEVEEFTARVRALLRRTHGFGKLRCGDVEIDRVGHRALLSGMPLPLTSREYALLLHLVHHADRVVTRTDLLSRVWETNFDPGSNLIEVHVSRLREKLGSFSWMIETVRGAGYRLRSSPPS